MSQQIQITGGAKVRDLQDVIIGTSGVLSSLAFDVANGVPKLDSNGKILVSQLPNSVMEYKGTWNAATNTPTLVNGTGNQGDVYLCNVAGTVNFGAGPIAFIVGDSAVYSGSIWQRSGGATGSVTSVGLSTNGGAITIGSSPVTTSGVISFNFNGTNLQYVNGAGNLTTFPTLMTSVGLTMPSAFTVTNSPLTGAGGTLAVTGAGTTAQYIRGDGSLATFPTIATEAQRLITEVYNETGATLTKGTVVYINGGHGNLPTITKAIATGDATSAQTYGIVQTDITNNNNGYVVVIGSLTDLDTQAYVEGTQLYLSSTVAGAWTSTKQYAPAHLVYVAIVTRSHPTQGVVEVRIQNGFEMDELHNVSAQSPANGGILQYVTSTSLWTAVAGTTTNIAEGTNLYFTDARTRAAISLTTTGSSGAATYNSTTGVLNVPNYNSMVYPSAGIALSTGTAWGTSITDNSANWNTAYTNRITSATAPLSIISNVIAMSEATGSVDGYLSRFDWTTFNNKQATITLTTTGTSGAATFISNTLNIPNYGSALSGYLPLTGGTLTGNLNISINTSGDINYLALNDSSWTSGDRKSIGWYQGGTKLTSIDTYCEATGSIGLRFSTYSSGYIQDVLTLASTGAATFSSTGRFIGALTIGTDFAQLLPISASNYQLLVGSYYDGTNIIATATSGSRTVYNIGGMDFRTFTGATVGGIVTDISRFTIIASTGAAAFTGSVTVQGGLIFDTSQVISSSGVIGFNSTQGLFIYTKTGSSYDFKIYNGVGSTFMQVPTGTQNVEFLGAATFSSSVTLQGMTNGDGTADTRIVTRPNTPYALGLQNSTTSNIYYLGVTSSAATANFQIYNTYSAASIFSMTYQGAATFSSTVTATSYNRAAAGTGFLNGKYSGAETTATTGPIYCIGDSYVPTSTSLNSMYGIGYSYNSFTGYYGPTNTWGMYVAANGNAGVFLAGGGAGYFAGAVTATGFFESSDSRLKTLIQDNYQTKGIASITPKLYTKNGKVELGYYAQDFVGILDSAISKIDDGMLNLSYREVHTAKIYALEQEIKELKAKLN